MSTFSFNLPQRYSPTSLSPPSSPKAAELQIRLERTQKLLEESQRQQKQLQQELNTIRREYRELQVQQQSDTQILNLSQPDTFPQQLLLGEIQSFSQYAQTTLKKFESSPALNENQRIKLSKTAKQLSQLSLDDGNIKMKLSSYFDEMHSFCDIFIEALLEKNIPKTGIDDDRDGSVSKALHDSEMEKLKIQNKLYRVQRRFDEENDQSQNLAEQLKNEHLQIAQFTTKMFQSSPVFDDSKFVEKELDIIYSQIAQRDAKVQESMNAVQNFSSMLVNYLEENGVYESINDNDPSAFKRHLDNIYDKNAQNENTLQDILNQLLLSPNDPPQRIISEIKKYMKCQNDLQRLKGEYETLQNEKIALKNKVDTLQYQISDLTEQNNETTDHFNSLSLKVQQLRSKMAQLEATNSKLENEKSQLHVKTSSLDTQNQLLERQKSVVENTLAHSTQELTKAAEDSQRMKLEIANLTNQNRELSQKVDATNTQNTELQLKSAQLTNNFKSLSNEFQSLSQSHDDAMNEVKEKRQTVEALTISLDRANNQINNLKEQLNDAQIENKRLQIYETKSQTLSQEKIAYQKEIDSKDQELAALRSYKDELHRKKAEYQKLQQSVDNIIAAFQEEKEKNKKLSQKVKENEFLREKTLQFEQQISNLSTEVATSQRLKKLVEQYEATIKTLSSQSDNLQGQIEVITSDNADAQAKIITLSAQHTNLQRKYKDLKMLEKQEKIQLAQSRSDFSKSANENLRLSKQVTLLQNENDTLKESVKTLTSQNEVLKDISNKYNKNLQISENLKDQNRTLSEGLKTFEIQNQSLQKQLESQTSIISQLKSQFKEAENDKKDLSVELQTHKTALQSARQIEKENNSLKYDTQSKDIKIAELQSNQVQLQSQLDSKNHLLNSLNRQISDMKSTNKLLNEQLTEIRDQMNQLQIQNNSLKSQVSTKSLIIKNYESKLSQHMQLSINDSEKFKTLQIENLRLKENAKNNDSVFRQVEEFRNANQLLSATVANLESRNNKLQQINDTLTAQLESKTQQFDIVERNLREMKTLNSNLSNSLDKSTLKISELEMQSNVASSELISKNSIEKENSILRQKNHEMETKNIKLKSDLSQMKAQLSRLIKDNETLLTKIDKTTLKFEQIQTENRQLKNSLALKSIPDRNDLIKQKDETINQLRSLVASQESSISELERQASQVSDMKKKYENGTLLALMNQIESNLSDFPIDRDYTIDLDNSLPSKLRNISSMIFKVKNLYDEQERSIERLTSVQKAQHDTILRMTNRSPTRSSLSPRSSPRSPLS